ncbi:MAG: hypothetical protein ACRD2M_01530 [Terriglobales bacterium]
MIEIESLARALSAHVGGCHSAKIVCSNYVAFESWFRAELGSVLFDWEQRFELVTFDYTYAGTRKKADLLARHSAGLIVFEIKSLVKGADAQKLRDLPNQIDRLEQEVNLGEASQGVVLGTFIGYKDRKLAELSARLFDSRWQTVGPKPLVEGLELSFLFASIVKK